MTISNYIEAFIRTTGNDLHFTYIHVTVKPIDEEGAIAWALASFFNDSFIKDDCDYIIYLNGKVVEEKNWDDSSYEER